MNSYYFCTLWGFEDLPFEQFCANIVDAGFDGVETYFPINDERLRDRYLQSLDKYGLKLIAQHWETIESDVEQHLDLYRRRLEWTAKTNPLFINSQTGRDWFSMETNQRIIEIAKEVSADTGIRIVHETHRGKFTFCADVTRRFLEADPSIRLTADFSHWCNVSESLLEDQADAVALAINRSDHIHARVGHWEGPQVSDPRAPEWENEVNAHLAWWDAIADQCLKGGRALTITPEFGAFPYIPRLPYTLQPVADQWDINVYMMNMLRERFRNR